ncbi:hypothetical protein PsorP6_015034 [Peronosclerospora sorghi]|uniref:Uncharacterized protein n=1 Tax=Peronosclerospora sorghi TaxID=230839 RepID=A0ACC0VR39_9STRA|nr:hypothetical protein PsorP6_015034 [Peronosclerospora sorghi]
MRPGHRQLHPRPGRRSTISIAVRPNAVAIGADQHEEIKEILEKAWPRFFGMQYKDLNLRGTLDAQDEEKTELQIELWKKVQAAWLKFARENPELIDRVGDEVAREDVITGGGKDVARTDLINGESAKVAREEVIKEIMRARFARIGELQFPPEITSVLNKVESNVENERAEFTDRDIEILRNSWHYFERKFHTREKGIRFKSVFSNEGELSDFQRETQAAWLTLVKEKPTVLYDKEIKKTLRTKENVQKVSLGLMLKDPAHDKKFIEKYGKADD